MAGLSRRGDELVLSLSDAEQVEALHGDLRVPVASVRSVQVLDDARQAVNGMRAPGTGLPGLLSIGTFHRDGHQAFVVVHHARPRGLRVTLSGAGLDYDELIVGLDDPEAVAASLGV
jgi:hypothetical protein